MHQSASHCIYVLLGFYHILDIVSSQCSVSLHVSFFCKKIILAEYHIQHPYTRHAPYVVRLLLCVIRRLAYYKYKVMHESRSV